MKVKLQVGPGNTLFLPIPDTVLHMLHLKIGDSVKVSVTQGEVKITKA